MDTFPSYAYEKRVRVAALVLHDVTSIIETPLWLYGSFLVKSGSLALQWMLHEVNIKRQPHHLSAVYLAGG
jgi:hypothetical protein